MPTEACQRSLLCVGDFSAPELCSGSVGARFFLNQIFAPGESTDGAGSCLRAALLQCTNCDIGMAVGVDVAKSANGIAQQHAGLLATHLEQSLAILPGEHFGCTCSIASFVGSVGSDDHVVFSVTVDVSSSINRAAKAAMWRPPEKCVEQVPALSGKNPSAAASYSKNCSCWI